MQNTLRWTVLAAAIAVNAVGNVVLNGTWLGILVSSLAGAVVLAVVADYVIRGRRRT
ncbi:hypothetical protein [Actinomadura fibrosa]|uniref:Uncharacterized protein n=1 Tax=Actinomadura fibrosa TaxID=111802 RepID=A0ABW2XFN3_9ACTN|nr:hypothetical protein [Actinomadura fibrosa]